MNLRGSWARFNRERDFRTRSYLGPPGGGPAKFPELFGRRLLEDPDGTQNGGQMFDFTKKVDPSGSPMGADRSKIKCYIGRCAVRPFLVPRGPKICQKRSKNSILCQNAAGCRPKSTKKIPLSISLLGRLYWYPVLGLTRGHDGDPNLTTTTEPQQQ